MVIFLCCQSLAKGGRQWMLVSEELFGSRFIFYCTLGRRPRRPILICRLLYSKGLLVYMITTIVKDYTDNTLLRCLSFVFSMLSAFLRV